MTTAPDREPTLSDVLNEISSLREEVSETRKNLGSKISETCKDLEQTQKWHDCTWDVVKWVGGISAGLAVSAAIALVGIVLRLALTGS